jgi:hypothetical protein
METYREIKSLTHHFFDDFEKEDDKRFDREEGLRVREEKVTEFYDFIF